MSLPEIFGAYEATKVALDAARGLLAAQGAMDTVELKLKMLELVNRLTDSQHELERVQEMFHEKNRDLDRLEHALAIKDTVVMRGNGYYAKDERERPVGHPFCMHCWEHDHILGHLAVVRSITEPAVCPRCKNKFMGVSIVDWSVHDQLEAKRAESP